MAAKVTCDVGVKTIREVIDFQNIIARLQFGRDKRVLQIR